MRQPHENLTARDTAAAADLPGVPDYLAPLNNGNVVIGYVPEIHGEDAAGCPGYVPTRHELRQLARYWAGVGLDFRLDCCFLQMVCGTGSRRAAYAGTRLSRMAEVIGEDAVRQEEDAAAEEVRRRLGPDLLHVFTRGSLEEEMRVYEDSETRRRELHRRREGPGKDAALGFLRDNPSRVFIDDDGFLWRLREDDWSREPREDRLILSITDPEGHSVLVPGCTLARPAGWRPPYGLR